MKDIKEFTRESFSDYLVSQGEKAFRAAQVLEWVFAHNAKDFSEMTSVAKSLRTNLQENFVLRTLQQSRQIKSVDGTTKWLFKTHDGYAIETVMIPAEKRNSVCISTQAGCAMGCKFCRTGTMGLQRNLTQGEILEQFMVVREHLKTEDKELNNVIFMGMGEPLGNFNNVDGASRILHDQKFFGLGKRRITVSTCGIVPGIRKIIEHETPCKLAVSLNGTNDEMRSSIMPVNQTWPLQELLDTVDDYIAATGESVTFEYVLIDQITCTPQAAKELLKIASPRKCKVNAIALNQSENPNLHEPTPEAIEEFFRIVRDAGVQMTIRTPRGQDILAACGQLAVKNQKKVA